MGDILRRRVVLHGPSTLTISIPTKWAKKHGIKKGDELEVKELNNALIVGTDREYGPVPRAEVDLTGLSDEAINSILAVVHKLAYEEVSISFNQPRIK